MEVGNGYYLDIVGSPFTIFVNSSYPSAGNSRALGSGVQNAIIGRVEQIYLQINDAYNNQYSSDTYNGTYVYEAWLIADGTVNVTITQVSATPSSKNNFITI